MRPAKTAGWLLTLLLTAAVVAVGISRIRTRGQQRPPRSARIALGTLRSAVVTTGVIQPRTRIEVRSVAAGRVEDVLVREGAHVRRGEILLWMSSVERAALLDAARAAGGREMAHWEQVYKPGPVVAATDGQVIVRAVEPGQPVAAGTVLLVLSDRLIAKAIVDETDLGRVQTGQVAEVTLDAYPDWVTTGTVEHVSYESVAVNNVTMYTTHIAMRVVPDRFRSGMNAQVRIITRPLTDVPLVPLPALRTDEAGFYVLTLTDDGATTRRRVTLGTRDDRWAHVLSGLETGQYVVVEDDSPQTPDRTGYASSLVPFGRRRTESRRDDGPGEKRNASSGGSGANLPSGKR